MGEWTRENLWSIYAAAEAKAEQRGRRFLGGEPGHCTACGRAVGASVLIVAVHIDGHVITPDDPMHGDQTHPHYQGTWELGRECAKRVLTAAEIRVIRTLATDPGKEQTP